MSRHETFCRVDPPRKKPAGYAKYMASCHDISELIDKLKPTGLTLNALKQVKSWHYSAGSANHDAQMTFWLPKKMKLLFSPSRHNSLLALMRRKYGQVVLLHYNIIDAKGNIRPEKVTDNV